jgi:hypothetical protein
MNYVVYPRGFLGFDAGFVKPGVADTDSVLSTLLINRSKGKDESPHASNTLIDQLWAESTGGKSYTSSFAFRERILKAALSAFGTSNFHEWVKLQVTNPYATNMHNKFINETLSFIEKGYRTVNVNTWFSLIDIADDVNKQAVHDININKFFRTNANHNLQRPVSLEDALINWSSQEDGFNDMLTTLMILFGDLS